MVKDLLSSSVVVSISVVISVSLIFLASCSTHRVKDGPPDFYVDEKKIPDAVPKIEPLAKYGNMRSYRVMGKEYYVMQNLKHYDEVGVASWYGTQFHNRLTSSGERYSLLSMTAAHKTLPLPTYVEVTNLVNHRKVIVKVNDRGPFAPNRIIDLSYVAAKKLGMLKFGTATVRVRAINPVVESKPTFLAQDHPFKAPKVFNVAKAVYLQVGAFRDRTRALRLKNQLSSLFFHPVIMTVPSFTSRFYRVQIGPLPIQTAQKITLRLKSLGLSSQQTFTNTT